MKENIKNRLKDLQQEYQKGQEQLQKLEVETNNVRSAMLRISGAIQILEELIEQQPIINDTTQINNIKKAKVEE